MLYFVKPMECSVSIKIFIDIFCCIQFLGVFVHNERNELRLYVCGCIKSYTLFCFLVPQHLLLCSEGTDCYCPNILFKNRLWSHCVVFVGSFITISVNIVDGIQLRFQCYVIACDQYRTYSLLIMCDVMLVRMEELCDYSFVYLLDALVFCTYLLFCPTDHNFFYTS